MHDKEQEREKEKAVKRVKRENSIEKKNFLWHTFKEYLLVSFGFDGNGTFNVERRIRKFFLQETKRRKVKSGIPEVRYLNVPKCLFN